LRKHGRVFLSLETQNQYKGKANEETNVLKKRDTEEVLPGGSYTVIKNKSSLKPKRVPFLPIL
jgi:hypothetical protein